jgi:hypothetical protein
MTLGEYGGSELRWTGACGMAPALAERLSIQRDWLSVASASVSRPAAKRLRAPGLAAVLAFLVPGLGHLFQGRFFKGCLYSVCILGTFFTGLRVGDGKVVYFDWGSPDRTTWAYVCQVWVGLPALPALLQAKFRGAEALKPGLTAPLTAPFQGRFTASSVPQGEVSGTLTLNPDDQSRAAGTLVGVWKTAQGDVPIEWKVSWAEISRLVAPDPRRTVAFSVEGPGSGAGEVVNGKLAGSIPRSVWNWYGAPLLDSKLLDSDSNTDLEQAHFTLGTRFELGVVYTMIAGLLNILAIYDALEGPAYAEEEEFEEESQRKRKAA